MEILLHTLDKDNFFYDYITTMAYSQFGTDELFARGFTMQLLKQYPDPYERPRALQRYPFPREVQGQIVNVRTFTPMVTVPSFETKSNLKVYRMDPDHSAAHFVADTKGITDVNLRITRMTIISTYEKIIDQIDRGSRVMEFFRHIRNAAAHDGKFHFTSKVVDKFTGELKRKAEWNQFKITAQLQGTPLFTERKNDHSAFWSQGDFVDFLLDFENHHSEIKNTSANNKINFLRL